MKTWMAILLAAIFCLVFTDAVLMAGAVKLEWNPGLPATNLASYQVSWGTSPGNYSSGQSASCIFCPAPISPSVVERHCMGSMPRGQTFYYVVQAINVLGLSSGYSNEVFGTFPAATNPLGNINETGFSANRVDGYDLVALGATFGASVITDCAAPTWFDANAEKADINYDGRVDGLDLIILSANFGRSA